MLIGGVLGCYSHGYWTVISLLLEISGEKYDRRKKVRKTKQDQGGNWVFVRGSNVWKKKLEKAPLEHIVRVLTYLSPPK